MHRNALTSKRKSGRVKRCPLISTRESVTRERDRMEPAWNPRAIDCCQRSPTRKRSDVPRSALIGARGRSRRSRVSYLSGRMWITAVAIDISRRHSRSRPHEVCCARRAIGSRSHESDSQRRAISCSGREVGSRSNEGHSRPFEDITS